MKLRDYQERAVTSVWDHLRVRDDNPCVVIPTGGGKTPVIATLIKQAVLDWGGRVVIVSHVKELLEQSARTIQTIAPELFGMVGINSAGLGHRDVEQPVIVAGIQSVYRTADRLDSRDLIIVDEAHLIPPSGEGMYQTFISDMRIINPQVRVIGLTATPYRMTSGIICDKNHILNRVCYEIGVRELIEQGYLCLVRAKSGKDRPDTSNLHVRAGEFIASEVDELMNTNELVLSACIEIAELTRDRKQTLVFCSSVAHVEAVMETLRKTTLKGVDKITGETPAKERADTIEEFRTGRLEYLVNCQVLTTGFDVPSVDCVVLLRPTQSPGLYYQMVGRGFRIAPEKTDCLILDYGENVMRHGPVDKVRVKTKNRFKTTPDGEVEAEAKDARTWECPQCRLIVEDINTPCQCGYDWTAEKAALAKHQTKASEAAILSTDVTIKEYDVVDIYYAAHTKRGADEDAPKTLRVEYYTDWRNYVAEWVCIEHDAWAGEKAAAWWRRRSVVKVPETANEAAGLGNAGALAPATKITVRYGGGEKYPRIIGHELGEIPAEEKGFDSDGYLPF